MNTNPLVTALVVSYNAEDYILDTLQSIYDQTYQNIELVLCDDASSDKTVELSRKWMEEHQSRFCRCIILADEPNMGVTANINRGIRASEGEYIKEIAADDILIDTCIEVNVRETLKHDLKYVFSKVKIFYDDDKTKTIDGPTDASFFELNAEEQYKALLIKNMLPSTTVFYSKKYIVDKGCYDETYRDMEDHPMFLKLTKQGDRLSFVDEYTVLYRIRGESLSSDAGEKIVNKRFLKVCKQLFYRERLKELIRYGYWGIVIKYFIAYSIKDLIILLGNSRRNPIVRLLLKMYNTGKQM